MKKFFYIGLWALVIFEIFNTYYLIPLPGSQEKDSLSLAYFLYDHRWLFRVIFLALIIRGGVDVFKKRMWIPILNLLVVIPMLYILNFKMTADSMFHEARVLTFKPRAENRVSENKLIIGVEYHGISKAYPIQYLAFHHQVRDTVGGKEILVTYCDVCRSGIVFEPKVNGKSEKFRLVGMNHYNAMFEDHTTQSWWRQSTGEAVTGPLKGNSLPYFPSRQMTLRKWFELHPASLVMQADESSIPGYDTSGNFEEGTDTNVLTRTDSLSWKDKSWVIGIEIGKTCKAYDWNELKKQRIINDEVGQTPVFIALSDDGHSFATFQRPSAAPFTISNDTLFSDGKKYDFAGRNYESPSDVLKAVPSKQEFWHSWKTFHPATLK